MSSTAAQAAPAATRRDQLLSAAASLFAERGFPAVGIDDIGAAAGISGPGVYRHFPSKTALLEALMVSAMEHVLDGAADLARTTALPVDRLEALVGLHVRFAVEQHQLIAVWAREARSLSEPVRRALRSQMRAYERRWHTTLADVRPELGTAEVAMLVSGGLALLNGSASAPSELSHTARAALLQRAAVAAMLS